MRQSSIDVSYAPISLLERRPFQFEASDPYVGRYSNERVRASVLRCLYTGDEKDSAPAVFSAQPNRSNTVHSALQFTTSFGFKWTYPVTRLAHFVWQIWSNAELRYPGGLGFSIT